MRTKQKVQMCNGYRRLYMPEHHAAIKKGCHEGYVYEHVVVAEKALGRRLREGEVVHHLDCTRDNNDPDNLIVLESYEHIKLHAWMRRNNIKPKRDARPSCELCGKAVNHRKCKYCSNSCRGIASRAVQPSKEELEDLLRDNSWVALGKRFGVSDNTVRKWAKGYGLPIRRQKDRKK